MGSAFYSCDPPWLGHRGGITFRVDLPVATCRSDPPAVRREAALRAIAELPHPDVTIWSDGSARGGRNRAAQALIQFHHLNREGTVRAPAGAVCSSLRAELTAMREAFAAVAGLGDGELASTNYLQYSAIAARVLRQALKSDVKKVTTDGPVTLKVTHWKDGKAIRIDNWDRMVQDRAGVGAAGNTSRL
ncbi:hypothetical protein FJT64_007034 [Amphibalanus amphitrite]|uniref:RNase H type-1 domain-containing protein n=1 Tax=Amphibalanus amphitrite TaxID=1232801 RepID=A0A6A4W044_AMPAM|nr:hypothetical protein FJT64_007034 [Amphibalanus amphitrite]